MTIKERNELADALHRAGGTLEKAAYLLQAITENYFEKHNPKTDVGKAAIVWEFERNRAFTLILNDCLYQLQQELPAVDWAEKLTVEGGAAQ